MPKLVLKFTQFLESKPGDPDCDTKSAIFLMVIEFAIEFIYHITLKSQNFYMQMKGNIAVNSIQMMIYRKNFKMSPAAKKSYSTG